MADFSIGQGDQRPVLTATLTQAGEPLDLTSAVSVAFRGRLQDGTTAFSGTCTITGASTGDVSYTWGVNDTAVPGTYIIEFVVTWVAAVVGPPAVAAKVQTIPTHRRATLLITDTAA